MKKLKNQLIKLVAQKLIQFKKDKQELKKQIQHMTPTPEDSLHRKFDYFYSGYNYTANTHKYLTFEDDAKPVFLRKDLPMSEDHTN